MQTLLLYFINNNYFWVLLLIGVGFAISHFLKIDVIKSFFNRIFQSNKYKQNIKISEQQKKLQVVQNVQRNYFQLNKQLINQNNGFSNFLQQQILKQLCKNNNYFDILQRYNSTIVQRLKRVNEKIQIIQKKCTTVYLQKDKSKKILYVSLQLFIYKIITIIKQYKKRNQNLQLLLPQLQRQIVNITKQTLQFLNNFNCSYGKLGNPLNQIYKTKQAQSFIQKIKNNLSLQKNQMILKTINQLNVYKQSIINYIDKF